MVACAAFESRHLRFSEHTLGIAIGEAGMQRLDDVCCFAALWRSMMQNGLTKFDGLIWILVAHQLVRPAIIDALRNMVCFQRLVASQRNIEDVVTRLVRRHGFAMSRVNKGRS